MHFRKVTGEERDRLLGSRKPTGQDLTPYLEALRSLANGDVVAVETTSAATRAEKVRFGRAVSQLGKRLTWLPPINPQEIVFQIGPAPTKRNQQAG